MARLQLMNPNALDSAQRRQYERFPANLTLGLLLADQRLAQAVPELANSFRASSLNVALREAVIIRVATLQRSDYELKQHGQEVIKAGWTSSDLEAIALGRFDALPDPAAAVLRFVDQVVERGDVDDAIFAQVQDLLSARDIATVLLLVGHYMMVARFTKVLRIEVDAEADSFTNEH